MFVTACWSRGRCLLTVRLYNCVRHSMLVSGALSVNWEALQEARTTMEERKKVQNCSISLSFKQNIEGNVFIHLIKWV